MCLPACYTARVPLLRLPCVWLCVAPPWGVGGGNTGLLRRLGGFIGPAFLEVWSSLPVLFLLIILASIITPNFWWLLGLMLLFEWTSLVDVVRAEFCAAAI